MTRDEAGAMADETISYWRVYGVRAVDVGAELRCHRSWPAIRDRMISWLLSQDETQRLAA